MRVGIVGHAAEKFNLETGEAARGLIRDLLSPEDTVAVSGRSPMGGVDVWVESIAKALGRECIIHPPARRTWKGPGRFPRAERFDCPVVGEGDLYCGGGVPTGLLRYALR